MIYLNKIFFAWLKQILEDSEIPFFESLFSIPLKKLTNAVINVHFLYMIDNSLKSNILKKNKNND